MTLLWIVHKNWKTVHIWKKKGENNSDYDKARNALQSIGLNPLQIISKIWFKKVENIKKKSLS